MPDIFLSGHFPKKILPFFEGTRDLMEGEMLMRILLSKGLIMTIDNLVLKKKRSIFFLCEKSE